MIWLLLCMNHHQDSAILLFKYKTMHTSGVVSPRIPAEVKLLTSSTVTVKVGRNAVPQESHPLDCEMDASHCYVMTSIISEAMMEKELTTPCIYCKPGHWNGKASNKPTQLEDHCRSGGVVWWHTNSNLLSLGAFVALPQAPSSQVLNSSKAPGTLNMVGQTSSTYSVSKKVCKFHFYCSLVWVWLYPLPARSQCRSNEYVEVRAHPPTLQGEGV